MPRFTLFLIAMLMAVAGFPAQAQERSVTLLGKQFAFEFPSRYQYDFRFKFNDDEEKVVFRSGPVFVHIMARRNSNEQSNPFCAYNERDLISKMEKGEEVKENEVIPGELEILPSLIEKYQCKTRDSIQIDAIARNACGNNCAISITYIIDSESAEASDVDWNTISQLENTLIELSQSSLDRL